MIKPNITVKANYNRKLVTVRVNGINSDDWVDIVGTRLELAHDDNFNNIFSTRSTTHYKARAYIEFPNSPAKPGQTVYGRATLRKNDDTTVTRLFSFTVPLPALGTVKDENGTRYIVEMMKMDKNGTWSGRFAGSAVVTAGLAEHIDIVADASGNMSIRNKWSSPVVVQNVTQGTAPVNVTSESTTTIPVNNGDVVRVTESQANVSFRRWGRSMDALCKGVSAHISYIPGMERFTTDEGGTTVPARFFFAFNYNGTLTSLPEGSFDTHKLTTLGTNSGLSLFENFNCSGALTSLPEGSFDLSNFTSLGEGSFRGFNATGALASLPEGSFDFDNVIGLGEGSFNTFNSNGALTLLPEGSFGFSSLTELPLSFCSSFNTNGRLATLPAGSFHFQDGTEISSGFGYFNQNGALTALPEKSFNFVIGKSDSTSIGGFRSFNQSGRLTSLPAGSFRFNTTRDDYSITGMSSFTNFNTNGALTSLPEGSFDTSHISSIQAGADSAFSYFNYNGQLTSLPDGSFNFDRLTAINAPGAFARFNSGGALITLPKGSFSFKNLTTIQDSTTMDRFAYRFNYNGALIYLPVDAFSTNAITSSLIDGVFVSFNERGKLTKSDTDYNPNFIYPNSASSTSVTAYYYNASTQTEYTETVSRGNQFKYYCADLFNVSYTESQAYTTDIANIYLSGSTVTFHATSTVSEYVVVPTITTDGGTTVSVTDNGDGSFTFVMPQDNITVSFAVVLAPAKIVLVAEEAGTMVVRNKWRTPITVKNTTQGTEPVTVASGSTTNVTVAVDDVVTVTEGSTGSTFRSWTASSYEQGLATGVNSHITEMPAMNRFTLTDAGNIANDYFFAGFCSGSSGKGITSLPAGSFDTSNITTARGSSFFASFNKNGKLTSLPAGSFDTSNISGTNYGLFANFNNGGALTSLPDGSFRLNSALTRTAWSFFEQFNQNGQLTSLPAGSFNTDNITTFGRNAFGYFNEGGQLTSLPAGSFNISNVTDLSGGYIFSRFNYSGQLTSLPAGSFDTSSVTKFGIGTFANFNNSGKLTSLPDGSFDISNVTGAVGDESFYNFNANGKLTSLPAGSFDTSGITTLGRSSFANFNNSGKLTSLPDGSFDISNITTVGDNAFTSFNRSGQLTSLPAGSFDTSSITTAGGGFFSYFNYNGQLTSLPAGSFDTSSITTLGDYAFASFNNFGSLRSLPAGSFDMSNVTTVGSSPFISFNYGGYIPGHATDYNANFINPTSSDITAYYATPSGGSTSGVTVAPGEPFRYKTT